MISPEYLHNQVLAEISQLKKERFCPEITADIDAIFVFANKNPVIDSARVQKGIEVVKGIIAARLKQSDRPNGEETERQDSIRYGPYFIYNGTPEENDNLKRLIREKTVDLPLKRLILVETIEENGEIVPIRSTLDQVRSLPKFLFGENGIVKYKLALTSNAEHFPRIWRYFKHWLQIPEEVKVVSFPCTDQIIDFTSEEEAEKVVQYYLKGDLAFEPIPHD